MVDGVPIGRELNEVGPEETSIFKSGNEAVSIAVSATGNARFVIGECVKRRLTRSRRVRGQEHGAGCPRLTIDALLGIQMDATRAHIAKFKRIVLLEHVLHAERPLDGLRIQLVDDDVIARAEDLAGHSGGDLRLNAIGSSWAEGSEASRARLDPAVSQITRNVRRKRRINRSTQLWRQRQNADVV